MGKYDIQAALIQKNKPRKNPRWNLYEIKATYKVDGEVIKKEWTIEAKNVFIADNWANVMIENKAGTLKEAKKNIQKI